MSTPNHDHLEEPMPAELTYTRDGMHGLACPEHPENARDGLTFPHATNAVAKHNRDLHAEPQVNVSAAARAAYDLLDADAWETPIQRVQFLAVSSAATEFLEALTGLQGLAAIEQAAEWAYAEPAITAHVAPF